jgi:MFS family permease
MVYTLAITETISYGVLFYAFTVFIQPMAGELGWSRGDITLGYSISVAVSALFGIAQGRWLDRHGARGVMTLGSLLAALLVFGWSQVQTLPVYYVLWVGIGFAKTMVFYEPAFWVVSAWFARKRRTALTVMTFIAGFSSLIFAPLTQAFITQLGWRGALVAYALLLALVTLPLHALVIRRRPSDVGLAIDGDDLVPMSATPTQTETRTPSAPDGYTARAAFRLPSFWWLTLGFTLNAVGISAITVHLVSILSELGYDPTFAAWIYGLIGLLSLPGRLVLTPLGSRISPAALVAGMFFTQALGIFLLIGASTPLLVILFLLLFSAGYGAITPARAALVAEFFGTAQYGSISSVIALCVTLLSAGSATWVGYVYDAQKSYDQALLLAAVCSLLSVGAILLAAQSRRKS